MKISVTLLLIATFIYTQITIPDSGFVGSDTPYEIHEFDVDLPARLDVRTSGGSIDVEAHERSIVLVEIYVRQRGRYLTPEDTDLSDFDIVIEKDNNTVVAKASQKSSGWLRRSPSISFKVFVPDQTSSNLRTSGGSVSVTGVEGETQMRTSGGGLSITRVTGETQARTSGGSIRVDDFEGSLSARTSGGSIQIERAAGKLDCQTSGGGIRLNAVKGSISAQTSGGGITADVLELEDFLNLRTSGGSITATIPDGLGLDLDLRAGRVRTELQNFSGTFERNRVEGKMNDGGIPVTMRTSGGGIRLEYR